jgi:hypothetical protein
MVINIKIMISWVVTSGMNILEYSMYAFKILVPEDLTLRTVTL